MKHYAIIEIQVEVEDISFDDMEKLVDEHFLSLLKKKASHMFDNMRIDTIELGECP